LIGTIKAVEEELLHDGFVLRYSTDSVDDGVGGGEGAFLACSFWLADAYVLTGRREEAIDLFERLLALRNGLGLLSEEYDPARKRLIGNYPQGLSHLGLINTAHNLTGRLHLPNQHTKHRARAKAAE
jgi:GH15 family glucan-1,4-alpha-glucosidase